MKIRAVFAFCLAVLFALTPLFLTGFDGYDPEDFPVQIARPLVQPAGYAFSIWLLIYAGLILHAGNGLLNRHSDAAWDRPRAALMAALVAGIAWVAFAEDHPMIATGVILLMAAAAILALLQTAEPPRADGMERWLFRPPLALLAGWVTAAAGVSSGVALAGLGWLEDQTAALVALGAILLVAGAVQTQTHSTAYGLAVIWALVGVAVANLGMNTPVTVAALLGVAVMAALVWLARRAV